MPKTLHINFNADPLDGLKNDIRSLQAQQKAEQIELKEKQKAERAALKLEMKQAKEEEKAKAKEMQLLNVEKAFLQANPNCPYKYEISQKGCTIENSYENYIAALETMSFTAGKLRLNDYSMTNEFDGEPINEYTDSNIMLQMALELKQKVINDKLYQNAINIVCMKNHYNPVQEYFNSLEWDGIKRAESIFIDYLGAEDNDLNRTMTRKWLLAGVARTYHPGLKFDNCLIIKGPQGGGKTTIFQRLGLEGRGNNSLFVDNVDIDGQYAEVLKNAFIVSFDEMAGMSKKEIEKLKTFFSSTEDVQRLAYRRNAANYKRHCIFCATTNNETFLKDYTSKGERRFWTIEVTREHQNCIISKFTNEIVDQVWAEIVYMYKQDPNVYLELTPEENLELTNIQQQFKTYREDDIYDDIREILSRKYKLNAKGEFESKYSFLDQTKMNEPLDGKYIERIPVSYVTFYLENIHKSSRNNANIINALDDLIITKKAAKYNKITQKCYFLKNQNEENRQLFKSKENATDLFV